MFRSNNTKTTAVLVVASICYNSLIMGPALSTVDFAFAKTEIQELE
ncbi:MAG: hypothetical protein P0116_04740 [Candidatus Nitrosocosmicus sp.]|nr:hypothetical protein [Candidatus Nitrosocosmicus sp.]